MITVDAASRIISENCFTLRAHWPELRADRAYPPIDRVMMDGIALRSSDVERGVRTFRISGVSPAGSSRKKLHDGCLEVMTGTPLPEGADLIIPFEEITINNNHAYLTGKISEAYKFVHTEGSDCQSGDIVLKKNAVKNGPHAGIAASLGNSHDIQYPKVLIISTGDELVEHDPLPHQLRRSNVHALAASLDFPVEKAHLQDDQVTIRNHYEENAEQFDVLIYSGGVSRGKFDFLPQVWEDCGVKKYFHGVAQKPGKPLWFGKDQRRNTTVIGLPGNPVSGLVCLHRYFIPTKNLFTVLSEEMRSNSSLTLFVPVTLHSSETGILSATQLPINNSGDFLSLAGSDGFIELPPGEERFPKGKAVRFFPWRGF